MQNSSIGEVEGKMAEVLMATSVETIKNRDCVDGVIFLLLISPFLTFLLPLEIEDNFINPGLIYSEMHFIWEVGACFLKGQEHHHSFESLVVCFFFYSLHLFLSLCLTCHFFLVDGENKSTKLS